MIDAFAGLMPVVLVILLGAFIRRLNLLDEAGWRGVDQLGYYVLFPAIIIKSLAITDFGTLPAGALALVLFCAVTAMSALVVLMYPLLTGPLNISGPSFTSIYQGATRWTGFVALALASSFYGPEGVALIAVAFAVLIPVVNMASVYVLSRYAGGTKPTARALLTEVLKNPFIGSCVAGGLFNLLLTSTGFELPGVLAAALAMVGQAALALALISVGAGLRLSDLRRPSVALLLATFLRLLVMPLFGAIFATFIPLEGHAMGVAIIALSVPSATVGYVLARRMGGDAPLLAAILTLQTLLAPLTLPLAMWLYV
ncbi:MAG: AEC family transporter [Rhodobiaceae bacterium]|nr:AEC family transporter [Rhodobiaceae bacterium]